MRQMRITSQMLNRPWVSLDLRHASKWSLDEYNIGVLWTAPSMQGSSIHSTASCCRLRHHGHPRASTNTGRPWIIFIRTGSTGSLPEAPVAVISEPTDEQYSTIRAVVGSQTEKMDYPYLPRSCRWHAWNKHQWIKVENENRVSTLSSFNVLPRLQVCTDGLQKKYPTCEEHIVIDVNFDRYMYANPPTATNDPHTPTAVESVDTPCLHSC